MEPDKAEAAQATQPVPETAPSIVHAPSDLPAPIGESAAQTLRLDIQTRELKGQLANGTTWDRSQNF